MARYSYCGDRLFVDAGMGQWYRFLFQKKETPPPPPPPPTQQDKDYDEANKAYQNCQNLVTTYCAQTYGDLNNPTFEANCVNWMTEDKCEQFNPETNPPAPEKTTAQRVQDISASVRPKPRGPVMSEFTELSGRIRSKKW